MSDECVDDLDAVRVSYDRVVDNYCAMLGEPEPAALASLARFADVVRDIGPVLDTGCGPGWTTAYLHDRGADVRGLDVSPAMIARARASYPHLVFEVGSVTDSRPAEASLGGVLGWWSWFHLSRNMFRQVTRTMAGALRPGGLLMIGTHLGDGDIHRSRCYGNVPVDWTTRLYRPAEVAAPMVSAGLRIKEDIRLPATTSPGMPGLIVCGAKPEDHRPTA